MNFTNYRAFLNTYISNTIDILAYTIYTFGEIERENIFLSDFFGIFFGVGLN